MFLQKKLPIIPATLGFFIFVAVVIPGMIAAMIYFINKPTNCRLVRRLQKQSLIRDGKNNPDISGMSYNKTSDELFLADDNNKVVRAMPVHDNAGQLHDVYRAAHDTSPIVWSVCHMSGSDTLLVCSREDG